MPWRPPQLLPCQAHIRDSRRCLAGVRLRRVDARGPTEHILRRAYQIGDRHALSAPDVENTEELASRPGCREQGVYSVVDVQKSRTARGILRVTLAPRVRLSTT